MKAKKLTSILLILAIIVTIAISATADVVTDGTITLQATSDQSLANRTFSAYQLFTVSTTYTGTDGNTYYNYVPTSLLKAAVNLDTGFMGTTDEDFVKYVSALTNSDDRAAFAAVVIDLLATTSAQEYELVVDSSDYLTAIATVPFGYYIIIETTINVAEHATPMLFALDTTNITIPVKSSFDTFTKTSRDESLVEMINTMDRSVGDTVSYDLNATYPNIYEGMTEAKHVFTDVPKTGLELVEGSIVLKIDGVQVDTYDADGNPLTTGAVTLDEDVADGFTLTVDYLLLDPNGDTYTTGSTVVVTYNATITENAVQVVGKPLENNATLVYDHDGGTTTIENGFKVYTYGFDFTKTNALTDGDPLQGAEFSLYSDNACTSELFFIEESVTSASGTTTYYVYDSSATSGAKITSGLDGKVNIYGLDAGTYYLKETQPPSGYNPLETPIKVTITANIDNTTKEPDGTKIVEYVKGVEIGTTGEYSFDGSAINSLVVVNSSSIELPSTGGIGTIMFGIFGCLIIVGGVTGITMLVIKLKRRYSTSR